MIDSEFIQAKQGVVYGCPNKAIDNTLLRMLAGRKGRQKSDLDRWGIPGI